MRGGCRSSIEELLESVARAFSRVDPRTFWPVKSEELFTLYSEVQAVHVYESFTELLKRGWSLREIANLFPTPSSMRQLLVTTLIPGLKVARKLGILELDAEGVQDFVCLYLEALRARQPEDPLLLSGRNIVWSQREVESAIAELDWMKGAELKRAPRLVVALDSLIWALYYDVFVATGLEVAGPYDVSETFGPGRSLLIRDYFDLAPAELWPEAGAFEPRRLRLYLVYRDAKPEVDILLHVLGTSASKLEAFAIEAPGTRLEPQDLVERAERAAFEQTARVSRLSRADQLRKGIEISYYAARNFFAAAGKPWRELARAVNVEERLKWYEEEFKGQREAPVNYRKLFDPLEEYI
jgi:hypothetical protein